MANMSADQNKPEASRFAVSKSTLLMDGFMNFFIRVGGVGIILAVFGILVFIVAQVIPLFRGAQVSALTTVPLAAPAGAIVGMDEHAEMPFYATLSGDIVFRAAESGEEQRTTAGLPGDFKPVASDYSDRLHTLHYVDAAGTVVPVEIGYKVSYDKDGARSLGAKPKAGKPVELGGEGAVSALWSEEANDSQLFVLLRGDAAKPRLEAVRVKQKKGMGGKVRTEVGDAEPLVAEGMGKIIAVRVAAGADTVLAGDDKGEVYWFYDDGDGFKARQHFAPFAGVPVVNMGFIFGDMSVSFTDTKGENTIWSIYQQTLPGEKESVRRWGQTKTLPAVPGAPKAFARTSSNKCYLLAGDNFASIRHSTTERVRADLPVDFTVRDAGFGAHYGLAWFVDGKGDLRRYHIDDPHPEAGFAAFFGKLWYEGSSQPGYTWQSTSGNDDFEPKLSIVPLMFGTIKGTLYAMLFAVPVALLAALYTSQFMKPEVKRVVKPVIELMASLPSVVLGFLAALWLAPKVEFAFPGILLVCASLPLVAMSFGYAWARLPKRIRILVGPGNEFMALVPLALLVMYAAWSAGPLFEKIAFAGDFPGWWRAHGGSYEQRNSLVVGFVMGFAVIPIVYTIAEDSLSNVPKSLVSASLALGASRWQTARLVVLPTASAGIFSALMIGFGRAVGETMIVVMATGNTAISEWNIFSGMRTASANIAVELPEAPVGSTHYRTLFLCACCLFLLTFVLNTLAETLRQRLREKYKVV